MQIQTGQSRPYAALDPNLRSKAAELETAFLSEMLRHSGIGEPIKSFGGGIGEEQFASFLREAQATAMVRAGGIGLTEPLLRALAEDQK